MQLVLAMMIVMFGKVTHEGYVVEKWLWLLADVRWGSARAAQCNMSTQSAIYCRKRVEMMELCALKFIWTKAKSTICPLTETNGHQLSAIDGLALNRGQVAGRDL
jgi:hypothetical protein